MSTGPYDPWDKFGISEDFLQTANSVLTEEEKLGENDFKDLEKFKKFVQTLEGRDTLKRVMKQIENNPKVAGDEIIEFLPVNREKLIPAMKKDGVKPLTREASIYIVNALSTKGGWKRFGLKGLKL